MTPGPSDKLIQKAWSLHDRLSRHIHSQVATSILRNIATWIIAALIYALGGIAYVLDDPEAVDALVSCLNATEATP